MPSDETLATILDFTPEDLITNRAGKLSTRQSENLHCYVRRQQPGLLVFAVLIAVFVFAGFAASTKNIVTGIVAGGVVVAFLAALTINLNRRAWRALDQGTVEVATGPATHKMNKARSKGIAASYYLMVGGVTFNVKLDVYNAFQEGVVYKVYYVRLLADNAVSA